MMPLNFQTEILRQGTYIHKSFTTMFENDTKLIAETLSAFPVNTLRAQSLRQ
jgi:hypothetical protein